MSTPNPITFPALTKGFSWTPSTGGEGGVPLAPGETQSGSTVGIRPDGDATFSPGHYKYLIPTNGMTAALSITDANWINAHIPPGNYWADVDQTDILNGQTFTSAWSGKEAPFSIPFPGVKPAQPTGFTAA
jgi:hypothetical protein